MPFIHIIYPLSSEIGLQEGRGSECMDTMTVPYVKPLN